MRKLKAYTQIARPHQYLKNGFIWLPLFFGYKMQNLQANLQTLYAFIAFCLAASSVYIFNDFKDVTEDRQHPVKKHRPLASGALKRKEALRFMFLLLFLAITFSFFCLPGDFLIVLGVYLLLNFAYTAFLKHQTIIDIFCIAIGFVLRILGGGTAANISISHWIVIMTFLVALFIALAKRRDDLLLAANGFNTRKTIDGYSLEFISTSMAIMASVIVVSYILFTVSPEKIAEYRTDKLYLTSFWVILGLLRYLQITFVKQQSGAPTAIFLKDIFLKVVVFLWLLNFYILIYIFRSY
jgi:4-hydroxybenzoate polyprenyltransferase